MVGTGWFGTVAVEQAAASLEARGAPVGSFRRLMSLELALAAAVLALTAALTSFSSPAR